MIGALALAGLALWPRASAAQSAPPDPPAWDAAVVTGVLAGRPHVPPSFDTLHHDQWYRTAHVAMIVGRRWTTHVVTELEVSAGSEGRQFGGYVVAVPSVAYPVPVYSERFTAMRQVSGSLVWQFFDNEWVHPFVLAGVGVDFERVRSVTPRQYLLGPSGSVLAEERREGPDTTARAGVVLGTGLKLYATPRVFVRTDARVTGTRGGLHAAFRVGVGADF